MKRTALPLLFGMLWTGAVLAQPAPLTDDMDDDDDALMMPAFGGGGRGGGMAGEPKRRARREQLDQQMRMARTLRISEELGLNEAQALKVSDALKVGDERRQKLRKEMKARVLELRALAEGNPAQKDVDAKIRQIQELRGQLMKAEEETLESAAKGLTPQQKAKMAITLGVHERKMRQLLFQEMKRNGQAGPRPPDAPVPPGPPGHAPPAPPAPSAPRR